LRTFIANTTHDVMLPVTVLQGHLAELRRRAQAGEKMDPQVLSACQRETDYVTSILQNLTAVAKLEGADYQARNDRLVIHNAVRYNRPGGHVAVLLEAADGGRRFSLKVIDDGPGIPEAHLSRLTERRFRGDAARTRNPAGLGLGLHIVREVAARHDFSLAIRRSGYGGLEVGISGALCAPASGIPTGIGV
jgi:signal transduction histidine kinase